MFRNSGGISHRGIISKLNTKSIQDDGFEFITEIKHLIKYEKRKIHKNYN